QDLVIEKAIGVRHDRRLLQPDIRRPFDELGEVEAAVAERLDEMQRQLRQGGVGDRTLWREDTPLRRSVLDGRARIDRQRRRCVDEDFALILAENDDDIRTMALEDLAQRVEGYAAPCRSRSPLLDCQKSIEALAAPLAFQLRVFPGPVPIPKLGIAAVSFAVFEPTFPRFAEHAAMRYRHAEYDLC